jgi:[acyl-carrier-protein] S-malonyltransferase
MKLALVFPGQGSQAIGMMESFADSKPVRETFDEASAVLGQDLWELVRSGPAEALSSTVNTQPIMLTAGLAVYRAWLAQGGARPALVAGHSLGEYTALVVADVVSFRDALPLVRFRAQAMQDAVPHGTGAMAAILGLSDDAVRAACAEAAQGEIVEAVNFNAPSQVVIAGHRPAVERASEVARTKGAKRAVMLPVSAPFHSSLLQPAAQRLAQYLAGVTFRPQQIPVVNNVDVAIAETPEQIQDALARQACNPVRWVEVIQSLAHLHVTHVAECGPGKVLAGLTKRIDARLRGLAIGDAAGLGLALEVTAAA